VVEDLDGNRYLDFSAGQGVCSVGHCHHHVYATVQQQLLSLINVGSRDFIHEPKIALCEKLIQLTPGRDPKRVLLGTSASDLVEIAAAVTRHHTLREKVIAFTGSSHGQSSLGSFNAEQVRAQRNRHLGGQVVEAPYNDLEAVKKLLAEDVSPDEVAAIFIQPIMREGGFIFPPQEYLTGLREICDRHHILLVVDENQIGIGSTGKIVASQYYDIVPDVLLIHRGLGSGFPIGALIAREPILNWPEQLRGLSEQVDSVACAAALATVEVVEQHFIKHVDPLQEVGQAKLHEIVDRHKFLAGHHGFGLMFRVELGWPRASKARVTELRDRVIQECYTRGLLLKICGPDGVRIEPPLCVNRMQLEVGLDVFGEAVYTVSF
jgi:4-aminobutyrate aminotransferase